jgi:hypothetical protein
MDELGGSQGHHTDGAEICSERELTANEFLPDDLRRLRATRSKL